MVIVSFDSKMLRYAYARGNEYGTEKSWGSNSIEKIKARTQR